MPNNQHHVIFDAISLSLLIWIACIFGPYVLLTQSQVLFSLALVAIVIALFTASFRWGSGFALLPGCLGMTLLIWNTATVCFGLALLAKNAGFGTVPQIVVGSLGVALVAFHIKTVECVLDIVLGPIEGLVVDQSATSRRVTWVDQREPSAGLP